MCPFRPRRGICLPRCVSGCHRPSGAWPSTATQVEEALVGAMQQVGECLDGVAALQVANRKVRGFCWTHEVIEPVMLVHKDDNGVYGEVSSPWVVRWRR